MSREAMELALEALEQIHPGNLTPMAEEAWNKAITALRQALETDLARVEEVGVGAVQCEPQEATEDGWCDWVCPKPQGYLMQCCDCELIHEVESRVVKYEPRPSEVFEVVDDPDLQVQWRMKRRDDISPKQPRQWQGLTLNEAEKFYDKYTDRAELINAIDKFLEEKNT